MKANYPIPTTQSRLSETSRKQAATAVVTVRIVVMTTIYLRSAALPRKHALKAALLILVMSAANGELLAVCLQGEHLT
jgi:hypothetical protein